MRTIHLAEIVWQIEPVGHDSRLLLRALGDTSYGIRVRIRRLGDLLASQGLGKWCGAWSIMVYEESSLTWLALVADTVCH